MWYNNGRTLRVEKQQALRGGTCHIIMMMMIHDIFVAVSNEKMMIIYGVFVAGSK